MLPDLSPESVIQSFLDLFQALSPDHPTWNSFWQENARLRPEFSIKNPDGLIKATTRRLSNNLSSLGPDHPLTQKFLSTLPLRYSKTIFSWPPTSEMLQELMTD